MDKDVLLSVVDDDLSVRESLIDLLEMLGFSVQAFSSAEEFLASPALDETRCLILDLVMPGMTGSDLQRELMRLRKNIQLVFITARKDESVRLQLIEQGAVACLFKPFGETTLTDALNAALCD